MIKMWSTLKKLEELNFEHVMVHTGQNFTPELKDFFSGIWSYASRIINSRSTPRAMDAKWRT